MMRKRSVIIVATVVLALAVVFAGQAFAAATGPVLEFKFAEVQPAQGIYARYETKFGKLLEERTGGAVKIALFAGGALGGEKDVMEGLRMGSVHIGLMGLTLMPFLDVHLGALRLPGQRPCPQGARRRDRAELEGSGAQGERRPAADRLRLLRSAPVDHQEHPGQDPGGAEGIEDPGAWRPPSTSPPGRRLGANPVPMAWPEVFTGLQQGTIDAQENPLELIVSNSLFEVQKYVALTYHVRRYPIPADERCRLQQDVERPAEDLRGHLEGDRQGDRAGVHRQRPEVSSTP